MKGVRPGIMTFVLTQQNLNRKYYNARPDPFSRLMSYAEEKKWGNLDLNQGPAGYESVSDPQTTTYYNS